MVRHVYAKRIVDADEECFVILLKRSIKKSVFNFFLKFINSNVSDFV